MAILAEKYATDYKWYVDVILNLIRLAGDYVSEEVGTYGLSDPLYPDPKKYTAPQPCMWISVQFLFYLNQLGTKNNLQHKLCAVSFALKALRYVFECGAKG